MLDFGFGAGGEARSGNLPPDLSLPPPVVEEQQDGDDSSGGGGGKDDGEWTDGMEGAEHLTHALMQR